MLTIAIQRPILDDASAGVPVTLASRADGDVLNSVEVALKGARASERLVAKRIQFSQNDSHVRRRDPVLKRRRRVEFGARSPIPHRRKGHRSAAERHDVAVVVRTNCLLIVEEKFSRFVSTSVRRLADARIELPRAIRSSEVVRRVDDERFGSRRVELDIDESHFVGFVER